MEISLIFFYLFTIFWTLQLYKLHTITKWLAKNKLKKIKSIHFSVLFALWFKNLSTNWKRPPKHLSRKLNARIYKQMMELNRSNLINIKQMMKRHSIKKTLNIFLFLNENISIDEMNKLCDILKADSFFFSHKFFFMNVFFLCDQMSVLQISSPHSVAFNNKVFFTINF